MPESGPSLVPVVYQVRVVVAGISPLIWRRLLVPAEATIADLPAILQTAFGWSGEHLHHFTVHGAQYGVCYDGGPVFRDDPYRVRLASMGLREGERFSYVYNFFAGWRLDLLAVAADVSAELAEPIEERALLVVGAVVTAFAQVASRHGGRYCPITRV